MTDFFDTIEEAGLVDIAEAARHLLGRRAPGRGCGGGSVERGSFSSRRPPRPRSTASGCACPARPPHRAKLVPPNCSRSHTVFRSSGRCRRSCPPPALRDPLLCPPRSTVRARARVALAPSRPPRSPSLPLSPRRPVLSGWSGDAGEPAAKKKRMQRGHGGKQGDKGLRRPSMKVCEKVEQKARTTYNEVADDSSPSLRSRRRRG